MSAVDTGKPNIRRCVFPAYCGGRDRHGDRCLEPIDPALPNCSRCFEQYVDGYLQHGNAD